MLYLNHKHNFIFSSYLVYLTLTNVVFESLLHARNRLIIKYLTLTNVVFEY